MGNQLSKKPSPKGTNRSISTTSDGMIEHAATKHHNTVAAFTTGLQGSTESCLGLDDAFQLPLHQKDGLVVNRGPHNTLATTTTATAVNRSAGQDGMINSSITSAPASALLTRASHETTRSGTGSSHSSPASVLTTLPPTGARDGSPVQVDASVASGTILPRQGQDSSEKRLSSLMSADIIQPPPPAHTHEGSHHHQIQNHSLPQHNLQTGQARAGPSTRSTSPVHANGENGLTGDPILLAAVAAAAAAAAAATIPNPTNSNEAIKDAVPAKTMQQHYEHIKNNIISNSSNSTNGSNLNSNDDNHGTPVNGHDDYQQGHEHGLDNSNCKDALSESRLDDAELQNQEPLSPSPPPPEPSIPFAVLEPGEPILVKRPSLTPLTIPASGLSSARSPPPLSPKSNSQPKSSELSPTSRLPFLGSVTDKNRGMDLDDMMSRLLDAGYSGKVSKNICLRNNEIMYICQTAREVFLSQPTLIELNAPVKIVGDIHGQYTDMLRMFEMCGFPPSANFLFLGDYVDRGKQSLETILLLFCYKIKYPENFFLLRGNHECANVTKVYGFYDECKRRASIKMWKAFVDVFNCLPLAAIVANKIFCVHGGLSPSLGTMDDIRILQRPTDVPDYGLLNDLLWSDPSDTALDWEDNERGVSYCFGRSIIQKFLNKHDFDLVCRAHMVVEDGYEFFNDRTLVTVFSAPNYCGEFDNFGAVMSVSEELLCSFELLKPIDQATAMAQMQNLAATNGGWRVNKQRLR
ncbi:hypothetical protein EDD11_004909 [Mortierella claussenii]|nr:hypothetical protein EDD11_004909 [Mortierella claussenii]